jgi:hypothetical protein
MREMCGTKSLLIGASGRNDEFDTVIVAGIAERFFSLPLEICYTFRLGWKNLGPAARK